jgi:hypothetical protein
MSSGFDDWINGSSLQLQSIIGAHNQWLPKTRSIPYWTTLVFFPTLTDLVLIYESAISSPSVAQLDTAEL